MGLLHIHLDWKLVTADERVAGTIAPPPSAVDLHRAVRFEPGLKIVPPADAA